jgi:hypothetical protein|tara:strand:+ start:2031 stop:2210 length:180 start_codon:yes stop_codon:yes gene_type:complete
MTYLINRRKTMEKETLKRKIENPVRALAKELEGRGQMTGIISELVNAILTNVKELSRDK